MYDRAKQAMMLETDRAHVLREMMCVCRPAGGAFDPGVYGGLIDKLPLGAVMNKGLTIRTGQTHVNRWTADLLNCKPALRHLVASLTELFAGIFLRVGLSVSEAKAARMRSETVPKIIGRTP
jgi:hypothetical protein